MKNISRRSFLKTGAVAAAGLTIVPGSVLGKSFGYTAPSDKLNIAGIGVGGMGRRNLANMNTENIVALCDVDWHYADKTFKDYPKAKRFKDWRVMFDEMGKSIDAIMVATPDHTHAGVTAHAITLGKHCYTQKPLTHSVYESRLLTKLAKKYKVATQMGNQGNSFDWCRQIAEWIQSGVIGDVYGSARLKSGLIIRSIPLGTGVDGGTSEPGPWAIWLAISWTRCIGHST